jgi:hypothetical protein
MHGKQNGEVSTALQDVLELALGNAVYATRYEKTIWPNRNITHRGRK